MQQNGLGGPKPPRSNSAGLGAGWAVVGAVPLSNPGGIVGQGHEPQTAPINGESAPRAAHKAVGISPAPCHRWFWEALLSPLGAGGDPKMPCNSPTTTHTPLSCQPPWPQPKTTMPTYCQPAVPVSPPPPKTSPRTLGMVLGPSRKGSSSHLHLHRDPQVTAPPWGTNALQGRVSPQ